ncbi:hypothetical protein [Coleofasciculus sp. E2-BRE-01]|uniref:hypothetical protein n=1 Tax=Coleofasciculus sp. E2-BRE-01 TaxID=3069524 RepID=UPI00330539FB
MSKTRIITFSQNSIPQKAEDRGTGGAGGDGGDGEEDYQSTMNHQRMTNDK